MFIVQSCPPLCNPLDCSPAGSSVGGILQARILERVAISYSTDLPDPGTEPWSPALLTGSLSSEPPRKLSAYKTTDFQEHTNKVRIRNFPDDPVAKTPCFQCGGSGSVPDRGARSCMLQLRSSAVKWTIFFLGHYMGSHIYSRLAWYLPLHLFPHPGHSESHADFMSHIRGCILIAFNELCQVVPWNDSLPEKYMDPVFTTSPQYSNIFFKKKKIVLFVWSCRVLVAAPRIFDLHRGMWDLVPWPGV